MKVSLYTAQKMSALNFVVWEKYKFVMQVLWQSLFNTVVAYKYHFDYL